MSPWTRATYSAHDDVSERGLAVSRLAVRRAALRFDGGTLRVRRSWASWSCRLSTGMSGMCPFRRLPKPMRRVEPARTALPAHHTRKSADSLDDNSSVAGSTEHL